MSTNSTAYPGLETIVKNHLADDVQKSRPADRSARKRAQSAPSMFQLLTKHAPTLIPTDEQLEALLQELKSSTLAADQPADERQHIGDTLQADSDVESGLSALDRTIEGLFQSTLNDATTATAAGIREKNLQLAAGMLKSMDDPMRTRARGQIFTAIANGPFNHGDATLIDSLIDDFALAHRGADKERTSSAAQAFAESLSYAIADFPVRTKCQLLVHQLWAAKKLDSFTMAKVAIDLFGEALVDEDPETTAANIASATAYIDTMPIRYSLMVSMELYQCASDDRHWQLESLQAIASKNLLLPETEEAKSFCKILNQQLYELRLDDADEW